MSQEFKLPDLGEGLSEAVLVDWKVNEGDVIEADQVLAEVETDKALSELPSPYAGKIVKLHWKAGATIPVGAALVSFETSDQPSESAPASARAEERSHSAQRTNGATAVKESATVVSKSRFEKAGSGPRQTATAAQLDRPALAAPATRKLARERGIDIREVPGTGPGGRITAEDVLSFVSSPERTQPEVIMGDSGLGETQTSMIRPMLPDFSRWGEVEREPASAIRRRIAQRMLLAAQTTASVTHMDDADVTMLDDHRSRAKEAAKKKGVRLTLLPYIIKAVVSALQERPIFNASYDEDKQEIVYKKYFHIGVAVDSPQGLLVPVVRDADKKTVSELARDIVELAEKAREGKLSVDQMRGGSFTITNVGVIGGTAFTPIINWPEVAILGLGRLQEVPAFKNGAVVARKKLPLALTFDHRMMDGAEAARFVNDIKNHLEDPLLMLLDT